MRYCILIWLVLIAAIRPASQPATQPTTQASQLDAAIGPVNLQNAPLSEVIDFIRDLTQANVFVNWKMLEQAGLDHATPVTVVMDRKTLRPMLEIVLHSADPVGRLTCIEEDGVIYVSTRDDRAEFRAREPLVVRGDQERVDRAHRALATRIPRIEMVGVPFKDVVSMLEKLAGAKIDADWKSIEAATIDRNASVTLQMHDLTLERIIRLMLDDNCSGTEKLRYGIDGDRIVISTRTGLLKK